MTSSVLAPASKFKLALIQLLGSPDKQANLERARGKILEAARHGAQVVVLPVTQNPCLLLLLLPMRSLRYIQGMFQLALWNQLFS